MCLLALDIFKSGFIVFYCIVVAEHNLLCGQTG